jgi:hypothetical protein
MEAITTAIIAALTAGAASGLTEAAKKSISDAYSGLKALIKKKFGGESGVADAIEKLEAKAGSAGRRQTLIEELTATDAAADSELLGAAQSLLELVKALPQGSSTYKVPSGLVSLRAIGAARLR